jgi:uncharacterized membrane protein YuzA (DUF378 family)
LHREVPQSGLKEPYYGERITTPALINLHNMKALHCVAFVLLVIGGLNWGLVGINSDWNLVEKILGSWPVVVQVVYILVGLSAILIAVGHKKDCKACSMTTPSMPAM